MHSGGNLFEISGELAADDLARPGEGPLARPATLPYARLVSPMIRLAEVLAALSLASDVGHDQPLVKS